MNANQQRFWMLKDAAHWQFIGDPTGVEYDLKRRSLRLANQRREMTFPDLESAALERLQEIPQTRDLYGNRAYWDHDEKSIIAAGAMEGEVKIFTLQPEQGDPTDIAMGFDGVLYIALNGQVVMHDRRERWEDTTVSADGFSAWRIAADPAGGIWVLDKDQRKLGRVSGQPLPIRPFSPYGPDVFRPRSENSDPPRLSILEDVFWPPEETPVALDCSPSGNLACLSWTQNDDAVVRCLDERGLLSSPLELLGVRHPYSVRWVSENCIAVLLAGVTNEAPVYRIEIQPDMADARYRTVARNDFAGEDLVKELLEKRVIAVIPQSQKWVYFDEKIENENQLVERLEQIGIEDTASILSVWQKARRRKQWPVGDLYPLKKDFTGGPLLHGLDLPPHYPTASGSRALHRLSFPFFTTRGEAVNSRIFAPLDSEDPQMTWHRLYLEGVIPTGCGIRVWLGATGREDETIRFHEHRFGKLFEQGAPSDIPVAVWESIASEIPHHPGLLPCPPEENKAGLFTALIQRPGLKVRSLTGRFLHVHVELIGNGNSTPEIFAIRAYGTRFSYVEEYLPHFYRETTFPPTADTEGPATAPDFLERYLGNIEGIFTNLEDRIAHSYLLTHPRTVPAESLAWLGSWIGFEFEETLEEKIRRRFLQAADELYRYHGTLRGLKLALELATNGGISGGEIVVLEDFRLRRTFATIIGADLDDADDPLTAGGAVSGNSYVGDTLFLGEESKKEFLALFRADLPTETVEQAAIDALFDRLAHRVTILVHQDIEPQDFGLIRRISDREAPAHVEVRIFAASHPLLVGMASLVGVDTYLSRKFPPEPARIGTSHVGIRDFVQGPAALDPRLEGVGYGVPRKPPRRPLAFAPDVTANYGDTFTLNGSGSRAFQGRYLIEYNWNPKKEGD